MDNFKDLSGPGTYVEEAQPVQAGTPSPRVMAELEQGELQPGPQQIMGVILVFLRIQMQAPDLRVPRSLNV